ncbi:hypothetical protein FS749_002587, partial [Ceratobasidium sp. UAMH 11750]
FRKRPYKTLPTPLAPNHLAILSLLAMRTGGLLRLLGTASLAAAASLKDLPDPKAPLTCGDGAFAARVGQLGLSVTF